MNFEAAHRTVGKQNSITYRTHLLGLTSDSYASFIGFGPFRWSDAPSVMSVVYWWLCQVEVSKK